MFKKRKLEVRVVEDQHIDNDGTTIPATEPIDYKEIIHEATKYVVGGTCVVIGAVFLARTGEHILVHVMTTE